MPLPQNNLGKSNYYGNNIYHIDILIHEILD